MKSVFKVAKQWNSMLKKANSFHNTLIHLNFFEFFYKSIVWNIIINYLEFY